MKIEIAQLLEILAGMLGIIGTLVGVIWNSLNKKIEKSEDVCIKNSEDIRELKADQKADHTWVINLNNAISDLRKK